MKRNEKREERKDIIGSLRLSETNDEKEEGGRANETKRNETQQHTLQEIAFCGRH